VTVLVTGASGFIGAAVVRRLASAGTSHVTVGRASGDVQVDLAVDGAADALIREVRPSRVIHLAWHADDRITALENLDWVGYTASLLRAAMAHGVAHVLTAGTCFEWGYLPDGPVAPRTLYGAAKLAVAQLGVGLCAAEELSVGHARVFYAYGPGEQQPRLMPAVGQALLAGETVETTAGLQRRDYLYVDDLADALILASARSLTGVYDVASGTSIAVREIIDGLAERIPTGEIARGELDRVDAATDEIVGDPTDLHALGWRPSVPLGEGLDRSIDWLRTTSFPLREDI